MAKRTLDEVIDDVALAGDKAGAQHRCDTPGPRTVVLLIVDCVSGDARLGRPAVRFKGGRLLKAEPIDKYLDHLPLLRLERRLRLGLCFLRVAARRAAPTLRR